MLRLLLCLRQQRYPSLPAQAHEMEPVAETRDTLSPKGAVQETPPMTLSEAIDRIGSGPFQTRLVMICGMVSGPRGWLLQTRCSIAYLTSHDSPCPDRYVVYRYRPKIFCQAFSAVGKVYMFSYARDIDVCALRILLGIAREINH